MNNARAMQRTVNRYAETLCAAPWLWLAGLLAVLIALHPVLSPATATWLQMAEREGESETPSPDENSQEIAPGTFISASAARYRRTAASRLAAGMDSAALPNFSILAGRATPSAQPAELAGRNGSGGPLRC
jgi:hypothetical protein